MPGGRLEAWGYKDKAHEGGLQRFTTHKAIPDKGIADVTQYK
jgi:hypothetical protein